MVSHRHRHQLYDGTQRKRRHAAFYMIFKIKILVLILYELF